MMRMASMMQYAGGGGGGAMLEETSSLLNFVDMASSNIKLALDKPVRSKRKVNHRKYLQKQLKRCNSGSGKSGSGSDPSESGKSDVTEEAAGRTRVTSPPACPPPRRKETGQVGLQSKSLQALFDPRTLHEHCCTDPQPRGSKVPLRKRNLPASFFTEPASSGQQCHPEEQVQNYSSCRHLSQNSPSSNHHLGCAEPAERFEPIFESPELTDILSDAWNEESRSSGNTTPCSVKSPGPPSLGDLSGPAARVSPLSTNSPGISPYWSPNSGTIPHHSHRHQIYANQAQYANHKLPWPNVDPLLTNMPTDVSTTLVKPSLMPGHVHDYSQSQYPYTCSYPTGVNYPDPHAGLHINVNNNTTVSLNVTDPCRTRPFLDLTLNYLPQADKRNTAADPGLYGGLSHGLTPGLPSHLSSMFPTPYSEPSSGYSHNSAGKSMAGCQFNGWQPGIPGQIQSCYTYL